MGFDDLEAAEQDRRDRAESTDEDGASGTGDGRESGQADRAAASGGADASASEASADASEADDGSSADADASGASPEPAESLDSPAFEYGEVKQSPMYARPEAWNALEDALDLEVVRALREAGVRNEEKRELHDAALRVAADHPDEIADAVREARRDSE